MRILSLSAARLSSPCRPRLRGTARAQDIRDRTIRFGHLSNTDHPVSMGVRKFAEILLEKSGGKLKVKEFPSNQLGGEMQRRVGAARRDAGDVGSGHDLARRDRQGFRA